MKKGDLIKTILKAVLYAGMFTVAASSPYFVSRAIPMLLKHASYDFKKHRNEKKRFADSFHYLKRQGMVKTKYDGRQFHISLTDKGKKMINKYRLDDLEIKKSTTWDKKWRILIFDVPQEQRSKREALRGNLKKLGLFMLQKSVWVCPYEFGEVVDMLRNFFGFGPEEMKIIMASEIENDRPVRKFFKL